MGCHGVVAPKNNFLDASLLCFCSCSLEGLVYYWIVMDCFFLGEIFFFFQMGIYLVGRREVATLQNNFFHLVGMYFSGFFNGWDIFGM